MAATKVRLKLLIDKKAQKVLFAEAGKDTVDFLFTILSLPVGTVIRILTKQQMVGSVGNLYESVESLGDEYYIHPTQNKDNLLKPKTPIGTPHFPLLKLHSSTTMPTSGKKFYKCSLSSSSSCYSCGRSNNNHNYVTDSLGAACPQCGSSMSTEITYVAGATGITNESGTAGEGGVGFVKEVVTYMVMDNLVIKPMSTISGITLLTKFNVKDVGLLEEKNVHLDVNMALKLLKESFHSEDVLTRVFLGPTASG